MATRPDIDLDTKEWVDINSHPTLAIPVGSAMKLVNKGDDVIMVAESSTKPSEENFGLPLMPLSAGTAYSVIDVSQGSDRVWARSTDGHSRLSVQEV